MIAVEGTLQTSSYTDKNGNQRKQVEVLANNVSFCGSKSETSGTAGSQANPNYSSADNSDFDEIPDDDDLPF